MAEPSERKAIKHTRPINRTSGLGNFLALFSISAGLIFLSFSISDKLCGTAINPMTTNKLQIAKALISGDIPIASNAVTVITPANPPKLHIP